MHPERKERTCGTGIPVPSLAREQPGLMYRVSSPEAPPSPARKPVVLSTYPPPPLQSPGVARDGLPGGGGRRSPSDGVPGGGGGGHCKGISRQTVVHSTDASKENTCEATFALMRCQCVSSNTNVIEDPKER